MLEEATARGYAFDAGKIADPRFPGVLAETEGQLLYEWSHLRRKLETRDPARHERCRSIPSPEPHPLFRIVPGDVQPWERVV